MQSAVGWRAVAGGRAASPGAHGRSGVTATPRVPWQVRPHRFTGDSLSTQRCQLGAGPCPTSTPQQQGRRGQRTVAEASPAPGVSSFSWPGWCPEQVCNMAFLAEVILTGDLFPLPVPGLRHWGANSGSEGERGKEATSLLPSLAGQRVISSQPGQGHKVS